MNSRPFAWSLAAVAVLALSACSSTVEIMGDYPGYDESSLIEEATLVIEGTALASEYTVLTSRFEGDTPEENPLYGLSEEQKRQAIEEAEDVAATAVTLRVDAVYRGEVEPGVEVTIIQTGGVIDGTTYVVDNEPTLEVEQQYLLFATDGFDGTYVILGGSAGMYIASGEQTFSAVKSDVAPFAELSRADVAGLTK